MRGCSKAVGGRGCYCDSHAQFIKDCQYSCNACSGESNAPCTTGQYKNAQFRCSTCSNANCAQGKYRSGSCSGKSNGYSCKSCSNAKCAQGKYRSGSCSGTDNGYQCQEKRCTPGEYRGRWQDGSCSKCDQVNCVRGQYRSGSCSGTNNGYRCTTCSNNICQGGYFRTGSCSGTNDGYRCQPRQLVVVSVGDSVRCSTRVHPIAHPSPACLRHNGWFRASRVTRVGAFVWRGGAVPADWSVEQ